MPTGSRAIRGSDLLTGAQGSEPGIFIRVDSIRVTTKQAAAGRDPRSMPASPFRDQRHERAGRPGGDRGDLGLLGLAGAARHLAGVGTGGHHADSCPGELAAVEPAAAQRRPRRSAQGVGERAGHRGGDGHRRLSVQPHGHPALRVDALRAADHEQPGHRPEHPGAVGVQQPFAHRAHVSDLPAGAVVRAAAAGQRQRARPGGHAGGHRRLSVRRRPPHQYDHAPGPGSADQQHRADRLSGPGAGQRRSAQ